MNFKNFDYQKLLLNLFGTSAGGLTVLNYVPVKYQPHAALGIAILTNLAGLFQGTPNGKK